MQFLDAVLLLGALQGFIISSLLILKKDKLYANKLLAVLLILISLACLNIYLLNQHITDHSTFWSILSLLVPLVIIMPVGPLIYFYVRSLQSAQFRLTRADRGHFYPAIIDLFPSLVGAVFVAGATMRWIRPDEFAGWGTFIDQYNTYADLPRWFSVTFYLYLTWKTLATFRQPEAAAWPKQLVIGFGIFQLIWLIHLIPYLSPSWSDALLDQVGWYPVYIPLVGLTYWLGLSGYLLARPQSKGLDSKTVEHTWQALQAVMQQDKAFLNPELSLGALAIAASIPSKTISAVLNQHVGKNFTEFVNEYRVEEVKKRLLHSRPEHLTLTGIAFECGFQSQATFQRAFKQLTGLTPSEFLEQQISKKSH